MEFKPSMKVVVRNESGYKEALMGISFNKDQDKDMTDVANKLAAHDYGHNKFLESIFVWLEVTAPRYWCSVKEQAKANLCKASGDDFNG